MHKAVKVLLIFAVWGIVANYFKNYLFPNATTEELGVKLKDYILSFDYYVGISVLVSCYCVGLFAQIPGIVFMLAARALYGPSMGFAIAHLSSVIACNFSFVLVRYFSDYLKLSREVEFAQGSFGYRIHARLEAEPIKSVILLRLALLCAPQLNYALGLSKVSLLSHTIGTFIGITPMLCGIFFFSESILELKNMFSLK